MAKLTRKQEEKFEKIHSASLLIHSEIDFDTSWNKMSSENLDRITERRIQRANRILGKLPSFTTTDEIMKYVLDNF